MIGEGDDMVGLHAIEQPDVWDFGKFFRRRGNANGLSSANFRIRFASRFWNCLCAQVQVATASLLFCADHDIVLPDVIKWAECY